MSLPYLALQGATVSHCASSARHTCHVGDILADMVLADARLPSCGHYQALVPA